MPVSFVLGIDPSAKRIAAVGSHPALGTMYVRAFDLYEKRQTKWDIPSLARALDAVEALADDLASLSSNILTWVEMPVVGRGGVTVTTKQAYVGGVIRATLHRRGHTVYDVSNSAWKKVVCGNGNAQPAVYLSTVRKKWPKIAGQVGDDHDLAAAAGICLYGQEVVRKADALRPARPA